MGRSKAIPKKYNNTDDSWRCRALNFVPVPKKRRSNRRKTLPNEFINFTLPNESNKQFYLGFLIIGTTNNVLPNNYNGGTITFNHNNEENSEEDNEYKPDVVLLQFDDKSSMIVKLQIDTDMLKEIFVTKIFSVDFQVDEHNDIYIKLYFKTLPLQKFSTRIGNCIKLIFSLMFNKSCEDDDEEMNKTNKQFYGNSEILNIYKTIENIRKEEDFKLDERNVQHSSLKPTLRPYQQNAVKWMLYRETQQTTMEYINPLFTEITLETDLKIYYNKYTGFVTEEAPLVQEKSNGGILADEMGLGKTVEVLACVLLNPKPNQHNSIINSDSEDDDKPLIESKPIVEIPQKIRKRIKPPMESKDYVDKPKKIKVPNDWVKNSEKNHKTTLHCKCIIRMHWKNFVQHQIMQQFQNHKYNVFVVI